MDPDDILALDFSYPGISFGYHSWALGAYLEMLEEFVEHSGAQYRLRAQRKLDAEKDSLDEIEYEQEIAYIEEAADTHIPGFARMSAILFLWGIFESTVFDITSYCTRREHAVLKLRDVRVESFEKQVAKYYEAVLRIDVPWSEAQRNALAVLHEVRNAIAHRNGQYADASNDQKEKLRKTVNKVSGLKFAGTQLYVSEEYVKHSETLVLGALDALNKLIQERYDGPKFEPDA